MADRVGITIELIGKDAAISGLQQMQSLVDNLNGKKARLNVDTSGVSTAQTAVSRLFTTVGTVSKGIGGTLSTLGRGMSTTGMTLRRISNMFGGSILNKASYFAIGKGVQLINQGLAKTVSRYDTFRTFPKLMEAIGYSATDSSNAIEKMNAAVQGLPTSLNDIVETSKSFIQLYGDINKGTDLAIAANNAFIANASSATDQANGIAQLEDLLAKGELTSTEWASLYGSMGVSMQYVAEQLGYSKNQMDEFRESLYKGDIATEDFLNALITAGDPDGPIGKLAEIMKGTLSASLDNVATAFANLGETVLSSFDEILKENTGTGLVDHIIGISDALKQNVKPAIQGWMADNADNIIGFFRKLGEFNWGKLASSVVDNAGKVLDFFGKIVDKVGEDNIINFVSFAMTWASPLAKALTLFGRPLSYMGTLFSKFGRLSQRAGRLLGGGGGLGGSAGGMSGFGSAFAFLGEIAAVGGLIAEFTKVAEVVGKADLSGFKENIGIIAAFLGTSGLATGILTSIGTLASEAGLGGAALAGEGLTAGFEGLVAGVGGLLLEFTKIAEEVSNADLTNFDANIGKIGKFLGAIAGITGGATVGFGIASATGLGGLFAGIGELLTTATIANIQMVGDTISKYVEIAEQISDANFPSEAKMGKVGEFLKATNDAFNVTIDVDKSKVNSINNALEAVKDISRNLYAFDAIAEMETDLPNVKKKIHDVIDALAEISNSISEGFEGRQDWDTNNQAKIIENMGSVLDNINAAIPIFEEIESSISGIGVTGRTDTEGVTTVAGVTTVNKKYIKDKFQKTIDQINEIVEGLQEVSNEITPSGFALGALATSFKTQFQDDIIKNYSDIMAQINGLSKAIQKTNVSGSGVDNQYKRTDRTVFDKKKEDILKVISGMKDVVEGITDGKHGIPVLNAALKKWESSNASDTVKNMNTIMSRMKSLITRTGSAMETMNEVPLYELPRFKQKVTTLTSALQEIMTAMQSNLQDESDGESVIMDWSDMSTKLSSISESMESVKFIVAAISEMTDDLDAVTGDRRREGSPMSVLNTAMSGLKDALANIPEDAGDIQDRANSMKAAVDSVKEIMQSLADMQDNIAVTQENGTDTAAGNIIQNLIGALSGDDLEGTTESIAALSELVGNIGTDLNTLGELDLSGLSSAVQDLYGNLDTLKGSLDEVASVLQQVADNAQQADSNINTLASTASGRATSFSPLIGAISNLAGQLSTAAGNADALTNAINNIPTSKTVTVTYNQVGAPAAPSIGGGAIHVASTGGIVPQYRARGGSIFGMRPVGTDTVPAMLTPGEFVLRRKAVEKLGVPFLNMLNGLNIPAAIDRLMAGVRTPEGYGVITNDNRRIVNNNQKFNQTVYTNNPSFARRTANRYARSL